MLYTKRRNNQINTFDFQYLFFLLRLHYVTQNNYHCFISAKLYTVHKTLKLEKKASLQQFHSAAKLFRKELPISVQLTGICITENIERISF